MTILELLDRLEAGISSLLPTAGRAQVKKRPAVKEKTASKSSRKEKQISTESAPSLLAGVFEDHHNGAMSMETTGVVDAPTVAAESNAETSGRILGKRQALGRSLLQLRKMSPHRLNRSEDN